MYLAFIHIGKYDIKARRHLACVQNGITQLGDWRMETWQLALRARCHVSIRQSPSLCNAILNTCPCLLAIIFDAEMLIFMVTMTNFMWSQITGHLTVCLTAYVDLHQRNIKFSITGHLWGEFIGDQWMPCKRASNSEKIIPYNDIIT